MRSKTSRHRKPARNVLQVRVITRRTVWFGFLRFSGRLARLACILAVLACAGWGVWTGIEHAFLKNSDFQLRVINLNRNPAIDEMGVVSVAGIDLAAAPNLFSIDIREMERKLKALPELTEASVERHPPGTLQVRVTPRVPVAWIAGPGTEVGTLRKTGSLLVDRDGVAFPCPSLLTETAADLPVIVIPGPDHPALEAGKTVEAPGVEHAFRLLETARDHDAASIRWIDTIRQVNSWSLLVTTRDGTEATFSLGDHEQQLARLRDALSHTAGKGYSLATINLIPKYNVPITLREDPSPPKAMPVDETPAPKPAGTRRSRDLKKILNRN